MLLAPAPLSDQALLSAVAELQTLLTALDTTLPHAMTRNAEMQLRELRRELIRHQTASRWNVVDSFERALPEPQERTCALCGHTALSAAFQALTSHCIFGGGVLVRHKCPECDVIFGADKMLEMTPAELTQEYEWHYKVYEEGDSTPAEIRAFHSLNPSRDGVYVNYGAGAWSRSVPQLREQGWNVHAYEPHASASDTEAWCISDEKQLKAMHFDGLFSNNVLEHLRNPANDLRRMMSMLKPGARMAHATPCYEYLYEFTRFHLFFFPGRSRELLASKSGLTIDSFEVDEHYMNCVFSRIESAK